MTFGSGILFKVLGGFCIGRNPCYFVAIIFAMLTMQYADPYAFCAFWATQAARALTLNTRSAIKYKKAAAAALECFAAAKLV